MLQLSKNVGGLFSTNYIQCLDLVLIIKTFMSQNVYGPIGALQTAPHIVLASKGEWSCS